MFRRGIVGAFVILHMRPTIIFEMMEMVGFKPFRNDIHVLEFILSFGSYGLLERVHANFPMGRFRSHRDGNEILFHAMMGDNRIEFLGFATVFPSILSELEGVEIFEILRNLRPGVRTGVEGIGLVNRLSKQGRVLERVDDGGPAEGVSTHGEDTRFEVAVDFLSFFDAVIELVGTRFPGHSEFEITDEIHHAEGGVGLGSLMSDMEMIFLIVVERTELAIAHVEPHLPSGILEFRSDLGALFLLASLTTSIGVGEGSELGGLRRGEVGLLAGPRDGGDAGRHGRRSHVAEL